MKSAGIELDVVNGRTGKASSSKLTQSRWRRFWALAQSNGITLNRRLSGEADRGPHISEPASRGTPERNRRDKRLVCQTGFDFQARSVSRAHKGLSYLRRDAAWCAAPARAASNLAAVFDRAAPHRQSGARRKSAPQRAAIQRCLRRSSAAMDERFARSVLR
jgi:hypothetical protein